MLGPELGGWGWWSRWEQSGWERSRWKRSGWERSGLGQKFRPFFFLSRPCFVFLFFRISNVFKRFCKTHLEFSGHPVKPRPPAQSAQGFTRCAESPKCVFQDIFLATQRMTLDIRKNAKKKSRGKKSAKYWRSGARGLRLGVRGGSGAGGAWGSGAHIGPYMVGAGLNGTGKLGLRRTGLSRTGKPFGLSRLA